MREIRRLQAFVIFVVALTVGAFGVSLVPYAGLAMSPEQDQEIQKGPRGIEFIKAPAGLYVAFEAIGVTSLPLERLGERHYTLIEASLIDQGACRQGPKMVYGFRMTRVHDSVPGGWGRRNHVTLRFNGSFATFSVFSEGLRQALETHCEKQDP